jgi:hypothetical protein
MTRQNVIQLTFACASIAGIVIWLSASGTERVTVTLLAILACFPIGIIGALLVVWRDTHSLPASVMLLVPIVYVAIVLSAAFTQWPLRLAYACERGELESLAQRVRTGKRLALPQQVGPFKILAAELDRDDIVCLWTNLDRSGRTGLVQCGPDHARFDLWSIVDLDERWQLISED